MPRGGKRPNAGRPNKYNNPVSINFSCERELQEKIDRFVDEKNYRDRSELINKIINEFFQLKEI